MNVRKKEYWLENEMCLDLKKKILLMKNVENKKMLKIEMGFRI